MFALIAAHVANVALNWNEMDHPYVHIVLASTYVGYKAAMTGLSDGYGSVSST